MLAPAACTARAVSSNCSRDSTVQGPAITTRPPPPIWTPRTLTTVEVEDREPRGTRVAIALGGSNPARLSETIAAEPSVGLEETSRT